MQRWLHRFLAPTTLLLLLCSPSGRAQTAGGFSTFEKEGRFVLPCRSLYEGPQPFDVLNYRLDVRLAMVDDGLQGKSTITMRLKSDVDSLVLNEVGLSLDTVLVDGVAKAVSIDTTEQFSIHFNGTRFAGDTLHIEIWYRQTPGYPRPNSRQGYYFFRSDSSLPIPANLGYTFSEPSDARFWFPCYDEPWEKATAEMNITVPSGYVAASNGRLTGTNDNGDGTVTWHWREDHQIATYLMCITTSRFAVSTLPFVKSTGDTIPLQYFTWPSDSTTTATFLPTVRQMVSLYSTLFGEYPFDKYGMSSIVPFVYLGMEHQTMTTLNRYVQTDQRVVSHELAHQWWGDNVTCGTWADVWLNEGFATYSEALWRESTEGFPALKSYMRDTLDGFAFGSWQGAVYDPVGQGFNLFDQVVYSKGAWVLHTLRGVLGDSLFFRSLSTYRQRYAGKSAVTTELESVVDSIAGQDMSWFFNQWVFGPGWPKYASRYLWTQDTLSLTIYQRQPASWPTYRMPMQIRAYYGASDTTFAVWDSTRTQPFQLFLRSIPDSVVLDPDGWILKQIVLPADVGEGQHPSAFQLSQNYPNPFNPATAIHYQLPTRDLVSLKVFDLLGKEVATLVNEVKPAGEYTVLFDASRFASGVYLYRLASGGSGLTRKMLLIR